MNVVYKYTLENSLRQYLSLPAGAQLLCVEVQHREAQLWALVDPTKPLEVREFAWRVTGGQFDDPVGRYVGTVHFNFNSGALIYHLFDITPEPETNLEPVGFNADSKPVKTRPEILEAIELATTYLEDGDGIRCARVLEEVVEHLKLRYGRPS